MNSEVSVQELANVLKIAKSKGKSAMLFLGAGASKSAGIPLAGELATILLAHKDYGSLLSGLADKDYVSCMTKLPPGFRKSFLKEYTETAKINQAHLYAAALVKAGYIDTIASVNFDQLMVKALSLVNIFPNVYDLTASKGVILGGFETPTVAYLHGQSYGFWQLNTSEEMQYGVKNIKEFFTSKLGDKVIIVLGYSGADPVFEVLSQIEKFEFGLYWVGYEDYPVNQNVRTFLEVPNKGCHLIKGFNADTFMDRLKKELKVPEPDILSRPFTHVRESMEIIGDFELESGLKAPWTKNVIEWIDAAIEGFEKGQGFGNIAQATDKSIHAGKLIETAKEILLNRNYDRVSEIENDIVRSNDTDALMYLAFIYDNWGATIFYRGDADKNIEVIKLGIEKIRKAIEIKPDLPEAYVNLGSALGELALLSKNNETFDEALDMYRRADELMPQNWKLHYNWGNLNARGAFLNPGMEDSTNIAIEKIKFSILLKPDYWPAYGLLGEIFYRRAVRHNFEKTSLTESVKYFDKAIQFGGANHQRTLEGAALAKANYGFADGNNSIVKEAITLYQQALIADPQSEFLLVNYALALMFSATETSNIEQCNEAISLLERAMPITTDNRNTAVGELLTQAIASREKISKK